MNKVLLLIVISALAAEWQTGLDHVIHNQPELYQTSNYPIHTQVSIEFQQSFSQVPQVLLMFEQMTYESQLDVDICLSLGVITNTGFELRYSLGGPAHVFNLKVRWVAFIDPNVQLIYREFNFMQLRELRQGTGLREDNFDIPIQDIIQEPKVSTFLVGFKINPENGPYTLFINSQLDETETKIQLNLKTKDSTHIRFVKVAFIIVGQDSNAITKQSGVDSRGFNYFEEQSTSGIRRIDYTLKVPDSYKKDDTMLSQGIRGFDANATESELISMSIEKYHIEEDHYEMNFGPLNGTLIYSLDFSILLYEPNKPKVTMTHLRRK